jgi:hypothetical protein
MDRVQKPGDSDHEICCKEAKVLQIELNGTYRKCIFLRAQMPSPVTVTEFEEYRNPVSI